MKAKTVRDNLKENYTPDPRNEETRFTNIPLNLEDRYHMENGKIMGVKDTKKEAKRRKRDEARKRLEQSSIFRIKFPATPQGVADLEEWSNEQGEETDYVLRPIDLPLDGTGEIVVYDDATGAGSQITDDLRRDYAASVEGGDYFNISSIKMDKWRNLDLTHKMRSRIDDPEEKEEITPDIIGKMD